MDAALGPPLVQPTGGSPVPTGDEAGGGGCIILGQESIEGFLTGGVTLQHPGEGEFDGSEVAGAYASFLRGRGV